MTETAAARFVMPDWAHPTRPLSVAHRGASAYGPEGSLEAYDIARRLGADFWEVDVRRAACGTLVAYHDERLPGGAAIADLSMEELSQLAPAQGVAAHPLRDVLARARGCGAGVYADIKDAEAAPACVQMLGRMGIERAIIGAFDAQAARALRAADCPYPVSALVPIGADPFEHGAGCDILHLCWEHMERPQDLLTPELFQRAEAQGQKIALWHEEDPARMAQLRDLPVLLICSDRPELVAPFKPPADWPVEVVCHRGATEFAPENTTEAAICAFGAGFQIVELDVHSTRDGELVVIHDSTLNRTTNGKGGVNWRALSDLAPLDAGGWYGARFSGLPLPRLRDILEIAKAHEGGLYVELKSADPAAVLAAVQSCGMMERCFFWSFDQRLIAELRRLAPDARLMVRRQDAASLEQLLADYAPAVVEFTMEEDFSEFAACRAVGAKAMVAYMGKSPDAFDRLCAARPDMVNLHYPFLFRDHLTGDNVETALKE